MKTLKQIREAKSGGKEAYQKFFNSLLKKYGVKSPAELDDKQKKKFYNDIDKGWESDDPNDKNERYEDPENLNPETTVDSDEDMADKAASTVTEALKAGKGNIKNVDVDMDATEYSGGEKAYVKDMKKKYKVAIKMTRMGALLSGKKADIIKFMQSDDYGMDDEDIEDMWPELLEDTYYPKALSIIRQNKVSDDALEEAYGMNEKMGMCEHCGKMHEEGACGDMEEANRLSIKLKGDASKLFDLAKKQGIKNKAHGDKEWNKAVDQAAAEMGKKVNFKDIAAVKQAMMHESVKEAKAPRLSSAHKNQIHKIARKHSGDMEKAIKEIEKMKIWAGQGIKDNPYVMDVLRQHNEDVNEAMSKGQMAHDKEYMHKKLKGNNDKSMKITTAKALKIKVDGDTLVLTPKQDKLAQKHKVTIRNDKDGDISVWGKGDDVHKFMAAMGQKVEEVEEKVEVDGRLIGFKAATRRSEGEKQKGKVIVDRRTKGYKEAKLRSEKAKAKKEAAAKKKAYEKKYPKLDYAYGEDAELRKTMEAASRVMGYKKKDEDAAANSVASGNVDMAPNAGKKKKKDKDLMARRSY